ncbi:MAG: UvrD-helicase domain-containing protein [Desulfobacteraceae bacterium]|jgi:uncharacterized protein (TIGR00375 family)
MKFIADFHIHSKYSRATAKNLDLENLYIGAQIKGITVIGTGDFTHPAWWGEIKEKLVPVEGGLFQLKPEIARACDEKVPSACRQPVFFMLVTEISNIYKKAERTRKNHNLVFMPDMDHADQFNRRLDAVGNIQSDGRPILGLDARNLLEIVLETTDHAFLVPAHIWTPWFSLLGSKSGFDTVEACFEDLSPHIFALETGLSSDPPMNWRVSQLDGYTLISNSDAHSPTKLGREANCFETELSYAAIRSAMETAEPDQFLGTIEFYPEEGKYHVDGHRKCRFSSHPAKTRELDGLCPVCGKPLTLGVMYRIEALADRDEGARPANASPYRNLIPLENVLSEVLQVGPKTKKVIQAYNDLVRKYGSEFNILCHAPQEELDKSRIPLLAEAIQRMRQGRINFDAGYDGEFGRVHIFNPSERSRLQGQQSLFKIPGVVSTPCRNPVDPDHCAPGKGKQAQIESQKRKVKNNQIKTGDSNSVSFKLNAEQQAVVDHTGGPLLISAGPGTGKTRTITCRISALIEKRSVAPDNILAVTFTNKAAEEMRHRLKTMLSTVADLPLVATFHGFCWYLLKEVYDHAPGAIIDETVRRALLVDAVEMSQSEGLSIQLSIDRLQDLIVAAKQLLLNPTDDLSCVAEEKDRSQLAVVYERYQQLLTFQERFDFEDLIFKVVQLLEEDKAWRGRIQKRYQYIFVDEFQDINAAQYRLLRALAPSKAQVCVIGDPDQAIYGFRGSDVRYFKQFSDDYKRTRIIQLSRNYRSTETILVCSHQVIQGRQIDLQVSGPVRTYSHIQGEPTITVMDCLSAKAEAVNIGRTIEQMVGGTGFHSIDFENLDPNTIQQEYGFADFAVLCRTADQVQSIGRQLVSAGIPCQMVNRRVLLQSAQTKLLAALRVISRQGSYADLSYLTDLNALGISKETLGMFKKWAYARQLPFATALHSANRVPIPKMSKARQQRLVSLVRLLEKLEKACIDKTVADSLATIVDQTTLSSKIENEDLDLLQSLARPYGTDKKAFVAGLALQRDTDFYQEGVEKVSVMTLHAAKGLEFPVVFLSGCENNLLPYRRPGSHQMDIDEERRLFYVGMTRARKRLFLTWTQKRTLYGQTRTQQLSPFVIDIENRLRTHLAARGKPPKKRQEQLSLF